MATPSSRSSASPGSARPRSGTRRSRVRAPGARRCWQRGRPSPRRSFRSPGSPTCWQACPRSSTVRFRRCNARRSRSRCCARRRTGRPALASWGPRSCRSSGNSPTSGPSSSRSTTSTGSTVPRRRRSSSRCGACPPSGCGRSSPSGRVRPALWPGSSVTALWSGSSSVRSRSPRCTASCRHSSAGVPASDARADRAGVGREPAVRARDRPASGAGRRARPRASPSPRACKRWSPRAFGRSPRAPATHS